MASSYYRNPQAEADALLADGRVACLLEPSPPAISTEPWFADDPARVAAIATTVGIEASDAAQVVSVTSAGKLRWADLAATDEAIAAFCQPRWLANHKMLIAVPKHYAVRRDDLHRLAYGVISNARKAANGKFGLRWTLGGFGTPFFGEDTQVRVQGRQLVLQSGQEATAQPITTLAAAADFLGVSVNSDQAEHDTVALGDIDRPLTVDDELVAFVSDWFGMATYALEELRCTSLAQAGQASRVQLWPGHFDVATDVGDAGAQPVTRATYGASTGDADHLEPYLYVGPWRQYDPNDSFWTDPFWNDTAFNGASLGYSALVGQSNPCGVALEFYIQALSRISGNFGAVC